MNERFNLVYMCIYWRVQFIHLDKVYSAVDCVSCNVYLHLSRYTI